VKEDEREGMDDARLKFREEVGFVLVVRGVPDLVPVMRNCISGICNSPTLTGARNALARGRGGEEVKIGGRRVEGREIPMVVVKRFWSTCRLKFFIFRVRNTKSCKKLSNSANPPLNKFRKSFSTTNGLRKCTEYVWVSVKMC
jgi:hypothetical protein